MEIELFRKKDRRQSKIDRQKDRNIKSQNNRKNKRNK